VSFIGADVFAASRIFSSVFQMVEIVEWDKPRLLDVADAALSPSCFYMFVIFVSKSIVFLFVTLLLSLPLFVLPHGVQENTKQYVIKQT
jgi:hypothetical protein